MLGRTLFWMRHLRLCPECRRKTLRHPLWSLKMPSRRTLNDLLKEHVQAHLEYGR